MAKIFAFVIGPEITGNIIRVDDHFVQLSTLRENVRVLVISTGMCRLT